MEKKDHTRLIRIALIGPESSAKSTLSERLANHYQTVWVKENSREYLGKISRKYTLADIEKITEEQIAQENELLKKANRILFADTEAIISKVWCKDVFDVVPAWIQQEIESRPYDLYLLTDHDLEWIPDPVRENPHRRDFFFRWYENELKDISANYEIIHGKGEDRVNNAIRAIEKFLASIKN
jgi:NadR type nicotinamide-nucleotide adenylyltransferase